MSKGTFMKALASDKKIYIKPVMEEESAYNPTEAEIVQIYKEKNLSKEAPKKKGAEYSSIENSSQQGTDPNYIQQESVSDLHSQSKSTPKAAIQINPSVLLGVAAEFKLKIT
jgi:hypothetical protein